MDANAGQTPYGKTAAAFAAALVAGQFDKAHAMLSSEAQAEWTLDVLREEYEEMVEYFEVPPSKVEVVGGMTDWPDKEPGDAGWAHASIEGEDDLEAVAVVVTSEGGKLLIRSIEWGRP